MKHNILSVIVTTTVLAGVTVFSAAALGVRIQIASLTSTSHYFAVNFKFPGANGDTLNHVPVSKVSFINNYLSQYTIPANKNYYIRFGYAKSQSSGFKTKWFSSCKIRLTQSKNLRIQLTPTSCSAQNIH